MKLMALLVLMPLIGAFCSFVFSRQSRLIGMTVAFILAPTALSLALQVYSNGPIKIAAGGWDVPLGIGLYADGLTALMICLTAVVGLATSFYALGYFGSHDHGGEKNTAASWWPLWLLLWAALNALFLSSDVFNLYVTLELMGLAAVALVALEAHAVAAAMRYLLVGLLGSMFYLLGVGLLYGLYGTVDMAELVMKVQSEPAAWLAMALMTGGLLLKAALFPMHFWLPPAHANAPAPVSAVLSALVVKAAFYVLLRLWLGPFESLASPIVGQLLGILGAGAVLWGSLQALLASRLKLVVAYSTVAQLGYLFILFPLLGSVNAGAIAWHGGIWLALSHGLAKAGLFLAAGTIMYSYGHDRVAELSGTVQRLPVTLFAIGLASVNLMGLPPSGAFVGKFLLLNAAFVSGQWWWALVFLVGGVLAAAYSFRILFHAFRNQETEASYHTPYPVMEWSSLVLSIGAILLGVFSAQPLELLAVGATLGELTLTEAVP